MLGIAAAMANAIEDASGACLTSTPFTPERVLAALDARAASLAPSKQDRRLRGNLARRDGLHPVCETRKLGTSVWRLAPAQRAW
jgi:hypothetical protein